MSIWEIVAVIGIGFIAGTINVLAAAGSSLTVPLLIFFGLDPIVANATNRVPLTFQTLYAAWKFRRKMQPEYLVQGMKFGVCMIPGALAGAAYASQMKSENFVQLLIFVLIGVVLLNLIPLQDKQDQDLSKVSRKTKLTGYIILFLLGIYGGIIQIGMGFFLILIFRRMFHLNWFEVTGYKVLTVLTYMVPVLVFFGIKKQVVWQYGLTMAIGNMLGASLAVYLSAKANGFYVKIAMVVAVSGIIIKLLIG